MAFNPFIISTYQNLSYIDRIKLVMMTAMTVGHLAWAFVPTETTLSELLHFFGRLTIPLACFLVVAGFHLTKDIWGYVRRLFGFGLLAQIPFALNIYPLFGDDGLLTNPDLFLSYGNVLFTLGFGLLTVILLDKCRHTRTHAKPLYLIGVMLLALLSTWSDWGALVICWVGAIYYGGAAGFLVMTLLLFGLSFLCQDTFITTVFMLNTNTLMDYGLFMSVPVMRWYERRHHSSPTHYRLPRLLFYWYYVGHLVAIWALRFVVEFKAVF